MAKSRGADLVGHRVLTPKQIEAGKLPFNNVIITEPMPGFEWLGEATALIGPARAVMRSTYIRWALAINGLEVAAARYDSPVWSSRKKFEVTSLRPSETRADGSVRVVRTTIQEWSGHRAAKAHLDTIPELASFGIIDMYSRIEEFIFDLYRCFLSHNPDDVLEGEAFKPLRQLRKDAAADLSKRAEWTAALSNRLDDWRRKRIYDGLHKVFLAFCNASKLKAPTIFKHTTVETWAETIRAIALTRHALVHGQTLVPDELAAICAKPHSALLDFKAGRPLKVDLHHLQGVDCFCEQLLTALNTSMFEMYAKAQLAKKAAPPPAP